MLYNIICKYKLNNNMEQKRKALVIASFAVLSFVVVTGVFWYLKYEKSQTEKAAQSQDPDGKLPELVCNYGSDQEAYADAVMKPDVNQCACIKDEQLITTCKATAMDVMFYTNAIDHLDESLCAKINDENQKNACVSIVKDSIAQLQKSDPQYLAMKLVSTHNENAIGALEQVTQEDQSNVDNFVALALAYAEKGLKEQEQGKDHMPYVQKALEAVAKAKAINDKYSEVYRAEAYANEIKQDYNAARVAYDKAIEIDPKNVLAYAGRGHVHRIEGVLENAVADFYKASELDVERNHIFIYTNLCNLEYSRSHNEDAIKNCKIVTEKQGVDPVFQSEAYQIMSMIFVQNRDYVQARNYLLTAKTLTPNDANLYVTLAKLNIYEGNYTESETNARKAIDLTPIKTTGYLALSHALYMQEKYNESIQAAQKGLALVKDDVSLLTPTKPAAERDLYYSIANNYRQMGDAQKQAEFEKKAETTFNQLAR